MRRDAWMLDGLMSLCALLLLAGSPGVASARPTVAFRPAAVPVHVDPANPDSATFPGTGAVLGAGAAMRAEWRISGTEYGGAPSPLTWIKIYTPAGWKLDPRAFGVCSKAVIAARGDEGCPRRSRAGWGEGLGIVTFGAERVPEKAPATVFFRPGGLIFHARGSTPVLFETLSDGTILDAGPEFGQLFTGEVPLIGSVPGGFDASIERLRITIGAALRRGGRLISYATVPRTCPRAGFVVKSELSFLDGETVSLTARERCPRSQRAMGAAW